MPLPMLPMHPNKKTFHDEPTYFNFYSTEKIKNDWGKNQSHYEVDTIIDHKSSENANGHRLPDEPLTAETLNKNYSSLDWSKIYYDKKAGLRKADVLYILNSEEEYEYIRCSSDPEYFIEKHCKIMSPYTGELANITLRDYQKEIINDYFNHKLNIYATSPQVAMTTILSLLTLWDAMFSKEKSIALVNDRIMNSIDMMDKIRKTYQNLPYYLKPGVRTWAKKEIRFDNDSRIIVASTGHESAGTWIINDFAFMLPQNANNLKDIIIPRISARKGDRLFISSTPNGTNHFYQLFRAAEEGMNFFNAKKIVWDRVAGRDEHWKSLEIANLGGEDRFRQEYELGDLRDTKKKTNRRLLLIKSNT